MARSLMNGKLYIIALIAGCAITFHFAQACLWYRLQAWLMFFSFHLRIGIQSDVFRATCVLIPREPQWLLGSSPSAMRYWCKGLALLGSLAALMILWKMFMCLSSCFRLFFIVSRS
ncbi:hypothetical protein ACFX13_033841 [Malus domestica]